MKQIHLLLLLPLLPACQQQTTIHDSTISKQFAQMNKNGWAVSSAGDPQRAAPSNDPNVRVIREADFTGYHFNTNFEVSDPAIRAQMQNRNQPPSPSAQPASSAANPWGITPVAQPGR